MTLFHLFLVAAVQGITEFIPVSSSGHLIVLPHLAGFRDQGSTVDIAAHVGSLGAILVYMRREVAQAAVGAAHLCVGRTGTRPARTAFCLALATLPVVVAGGLLHASGATELLRNLAVVGWSTLLFGIVLFWADRRGASNRQSSEWRASDALVMGLWQAAALIPGASRAGVTVTGARLLGFGRRDAARLSMLMSVPTIVAAGTLELLGLLAEGDSLAVKEGAVVAGVSFAAALISVIAMMKMLRSISFLPFVVYRVILGCALILASWGWLGLP